MRSTQHSEAQVCCTASPLLTAVTVPLDRRPLPRLVSDISGLSYRRLSFLQEYSELAHIMAFGDRGGRGGRGGDRGGFGSRGGGRGPPRGGGRGGFGGRGALRAAQTCCMLFTGTLSTTQEHIITSQVQPF